MRARTIALGVTALLLGGVAHVITSDEFGRPERKLTLETFRPILYPSPAPDPHRAKFTLCAGPIRANCVVDGDTFWFEGIKIRIADIDAPEISQPQCAGERQAGIAARNRLLDMLNAGSFSLLTGWRDEDRYGRKLRIVARDDTSIGETLVREGLARPWSASRHGWCFADEPG
ncbi:thermonuclease family protein [Shinella granuli]|uniref:Endonuclease YncB(Thermonuclease family) n=1 Tax=Shinella granuli TaxID=323621 RepID=A0A4R2C762_SHIGR|nr:endonuclease YncB(thermonuclease family) [Shinella granuli]